MNKVILELPSRALRTIAFISSSFFLKPRSCLWKPRFSQTALYHLPHSVPRRWVIQRGAVLASGTGNNATTAAEYAKENLAIFAFNLTATELDQLSHMQI
jgi:hypothetical protein